jgi:hypothetical protein
MDDVSMTSTTFVLATASGWFGEDGTVLPSTLQHIAKPHDKGGCAMRQSVQLHQLCLRGLQATCMCNARHLRRCTGMFEATVFIAICIFEPTSNSHLVSVGGCEVAARHQQEHQAKQQRSTRKT